MSCRKKFRKQKTKVSGVFELKCPIVKVANNVKAAENSVIPTMTEYDKSFYRVCQINHCTNSQVRRALTQP